MSWLSLGWLGSRFTRKQTKQHNQHNRVRLQVEQLESRRLLSVSWDGQANDGLWSSALNWSDDQVPGLTTDVEINDSNAVILLDTNAAIASFSLLAGAVTIDASTAFSVAGNFSIAAAGNLTNAGSLTADITSAGSLTSTGTITGNLTNSATADLSGTITGDITSTGAITVAANLDITGAVTQTAGSFDITAAAVTISQTFGLDDGTLDIDASGSLAATGGLTIAAPATTTNAGALTVDISNAGSLTSTGTITGNFTNSATVDLSGAFTGDITNTGTITIAASLDVAGAVTQTAGSFNITSAAVTISQTFALDDGTLDIGASSSLAATGGLTVAALATTTNAGTLTADITNAGALTSSGIITGNIINSATADLSGAVTGDITNTGAITVAANLDMTGTVTQSAGSFGITAAAVTVSQTFALDDGTLDIDASSSLAATGGLTIAAPATATNAGTLTANISNAGSLTSTGTITGNVSNSATADLSGAITGDITSTGAINIAANLDITGAITQTAGSFDITAAAVTVTQTFVLNDGTLDIDASSSLAATGGLTIAAPATPTNSGTLAADITNAGSLTSTGNITGNITNSATADLSGTITGDVTNSGTIAVVANLDITGAVAQTAGSFDITAAAVTVGQTFALDDGTLDIDASSSFGATGGLTIAAPGTATNAGTLTTDISNAGTLTSTAIITGNVTNSATADLSGTITGDVTNSGTIAVVANLDITGAVAQTAGSFDINAAAVTVGQTFGLDDGTLDLDASSSLAATGGLTIAAPGTTTNAGALTADLTNAGSLTSTGTITGNVTNSATADLSGTITGDINNSGAITVAANLGITGAVTQTAGSFDITSADVTVSESFDLDAGGVDVDSNSSLAIVDGEISGGTVTGGGQIGVTGTLVKSSASTVSVEPALNNNGTLDVQGGTLELEGGGTSDGAFAVVINSFLNLIGGTFVLTANAGIQGPGTTRLRDATIEVPPAPGPLALFGLAVQNGDILATLNPNPPLPRDIHILGNFTWEGGSLIGAAGHQFKVFNTASLFGSGEKRLINTRMVIGSGATVNWTEGDITLSNAILQNDGDFAAESSLPLLIGGTGELINNGALTKSDSGTLRITSNRVENGPLGTINIPVGALELATSGTSNYYGIINNSDRVWFATGTHVFDPLLHDSPEDLLRGSGLYTVYGSGVVEIPAAFVRADNFQLDDGGTLTGAGTFSASSFVWAGGLMSGTGITEIGANDEMRIGSASSGVDQRIQSRQIMNYGNIRWNGLGDIKTTGSTAEFVNDGSLNGGIFTIENSQHLLIDPDPLLLLPPTFTIKNNGLLQKVGGGETVIEYYVDYGRINLGGHSIRFKGGMDGRAGSEFKFAGGNATVDANFAQAGGVTTLEGGTLTVQGSLSLDGGSMAIDGGTVSATAGAYVATGATLSGSGIIDGDLLNEGQIDVGGAGVLGTLSINGSFTQTVGFLNIDLLAMASSQYDRLMISGTAEFDGDLIVSTLSGFSTDEDDEFEIITFASKTGDFANTDLPSLDGGLFFDAVYDPDPDPTRLLLITMA